MYITPLHHLNLDYIYRYPHMCDMITENQSHKSTSWYIYDDWLKRQIQGILPSQPCPCGVQVTSEGCLRVRAKTRRFSLSLESKDCDLPSGSELEAARAVQACAWKRFRSSKNNSYAFCCWVRRQYHLCVKK